MKNSSLLFRFVFLFFAGILGTHAFAAAPPYAFAQLITDYGKAVKEIRVLAGKAESIEVALPATDYEEATTYHLTVSLKVKKGTSVASFKISETIDPKIGDPVTSKKRGKISAAQANGRATAITLNRAMFTLLLVDREDVGHFLIDQEIHSFESPVKSDMQKWENTFDHCPDYGNSDTMACPLVWTVKFSDELNLASFLAYLEKGVPYEPAGEQVFFTSNESALRQITSRYESQLTGYNKVTGTDTAPFARAFRQYVEGLLGESQLVRCTDTYWAPSVNSTACYFFDLNNNEVTRIEHGDTDG